VSTDLHTCPARAHSSRVRLHRMAQLAKYDRQSLCELLDSTPLCHISVYRNGQLMLVPTLFWREGGQIFWHGSSASRLMRAAVGQTVCIAVTQLDGLVLARSAFHHSANYRSAIIYGVARSLAEHEKLAHLERFMETLFPGRWEQVRRPTQPELKATSILTLSLDESSVKLREGGVREDAADSEWKAWAGVVEFTGGLRLQQDQNQADAFGLVTPKLSRRIIPGSRSLRLTKVERAFLPQFKIALRAAGLPTEGLERRNTDLFCLQDHQWTIGWAALERYGSQALLRSVVVEPACRGTGVGSTLVERTAMAASLTGVRRLWLLTHSAARFFERLGFQVTGRCHAPPRIQQSPEFACLCPASATCMSMDLE
jgi:uncharacterized protein